MGWNTVQPPATSMLFAGVADERFYFVHSYAARPPGAGETVTVHGEPFVAAVECGALSATQFHPEKSGEAGLTLSAQLGDVSALTRVHRVVVPVPRDDVSR